MKNEEMVRCFCVLDRPGSDEVSAWKPCIIFLYQYW